MSPVSSTGAAIVCPRPQEIESSPTSSIHETTATRCLLTNVLQDTYSWLQDSPALYHSTTSNHWYPVGLTTPDRRLAEGRELAFDRSSQTVVRVCVLVSPRIIVTLS